MVAVPIVAPEALTSVTTTPGTGVVVPSIVVVPWIVPRGAAYWPSTTVVPPTVTVRGVEGVAIVAAFGSMPDVVPKDTL